MTAHIMGIPIEESALQLAPASTVLVTAVVIASRASLGRLRRRLHQRGHVEAERPKRANAIPPVSQ